MRRLTSTNKAECASKDVKTHKIRNRSENCPRKVISSEETAPKFERLQKEPMTVCTANGQLMRVFLELHLFCD